jgi:endo-1,4-beta-xylanase
MGLDNQVTEMDVSVYTNSTDTSPPTAEVLIKQAYRYRDVFDVFRELQAMISSVTLWGLGDDTSWLKTFPITRDDKPLLFDEDLQAKPAFWGVVDPDQLPIVPNSSRPSGTAARFTCWSRPMTGWAAMMPSRSTSAKRGSCSAASAASASTAPTACCCRRWSATASRRPSIVSVTRGRPVVDGNEDRVWRKATTIRTQNFVLGSSGATAEVKLLWDADNLYLYATVTDPLLSKASPNPWEEDSVEIFLDQNNAQTTTYQGDDGQFRVNFDNEQSFGGAAASAGITSATRLIDGGYVVEAAIALDQVDVYRGSFLGFDFQVNNDGAGDGVRTSVATWNDTSGQAFQDPSQFGAVRLVGRGLHGRANWHPWLGRVLWRGWMR